VRPVVIEPCIDDIRQHSSSLIGLGITTRLDLMFSKISDLFIAFLPFVPRPMPKEV
jgi:hypothetical protein